MQAYSERYETALALAALAHRTQTRKGSAVPYLVHPVHVSLILVRHGYPEEVAIAGLLHDVVEDANIPLARIDAEFGPAVAEMVASLTEHKAKGGVKRPWETRKREALDQLRGATANAAAVKAADLVHNGHGLINQLRRDGPATWKAFARGPQELLWYYGSVTAIVRDRLGAQPLVMELEETVQALELAISGTEQT